MSEPCLPRKRRRPARYEDGEAAAEFSHTPEHYYRVTVYNQTIDMIVTCLADRFDQPGYRMYSKLEQLLLKACRGESHDEERAIITERYSSDIDTANLMTQLQVLCTNLDGDVSLKDVVEYLQELPKACRSLFSEVITLVKLILVMPASNSTCERSFSALRRIKMYLRSTMSQVRLNNLMVLHVHWDRVDKLDLCQTANEFIDARDFRRSIFGRFK